MSVACLDLWFSAPPSSPSSIHSSLSAAHSTSPSNEVLPAGYDAGVLTAWRDAGILFRQNISRIEITLNHRSSPIKTVFNPEGFQRIQNKILGPQTNIRTIEGRLLLWMFKRYMERGLVKLCTDTDGASFILAGISIYSSHPLKHAIRHG